MATHAPQPSPIEASLIEPPPRDLDRKPAIRFLHPGYRRPVNVMLTLPQVDAESSNGTIAYGVHHKTALTACQIIAGNVFYTGYFASDSAGLYRENVSLDGLLTENFYYFIVEGNDKYPIVPSFRDWESPHEEVPDLWPTVSMNYFVKPGSYESLCSVTNVSYAVDRVHLVPQEEAAWYNYNGMRIYRDYIDSEDNILCLRKSLRNCFNNGWFAIVPKLTQNSIQCVTHILSHNAAEIWPTHQNCIVRGLSLPSRPHLFARFAWAVFLRTKLFVIQGFPLQVIRVHNDWDEGILEYKQELMTGTQLQRLYGEDRFTSATPTSGDDMDGSETEVEIVDW